MPAHVLWRFVLLGCLVAELGCSLSFCSDTTLHREIFRIVLTISLIALATCVTLLVTWFAWLSPTFPGLFTVLEPAVTVLLIIGVRCVAAAGYCNQPYNGTCDSTQESWVGPFMVGPVNCGDLSWPHTLLLCCRALAASSSLASVGLGWSQSRMS